MVSKRYIADSAYLIKCISEALLLCVPPQSYSAKNVGKSSSYHSHHKSWFCRAWECAITTGHHLFIYTLIKQNSQDYIQGTIFVICLGWPQMSRKAAVISGYPFKGTAPCPLQPGSSPEGRLYPTWRLSELPSRTSTPQQETRPEQLLSK